MRKDFCSDFAKLLFVISWLTEDEVERFEWGVRCLNSAGISGRWASGVAFQDESGCERRRQRSEGVHCTNTAGA